MREKKSTKKKRQGPQALTVLGFAHDVARHNVERLSGERFPLVSYQKDPVRFVREKIGQEPLPHQAEIMMAVAEGTSPKVSVRSGQKCGKTLLVTWLALWFAACFPGGRVFMTASTSEQIDRVIWTELVNTVRIARQWRKRCTVCGATYRKVDAEAEDEWMAHTTCGDCPRPRLPGAPDMGESTDFGDPPQNPAAGWGIGAGEIWGFTTRTIEAMAGLSGANMLFIADEASALERAMAEAIEGNTAGAARMIWISNPTRAEGPFYDTFFSRKKYWRNYHLSSEKLARENAAKSLTVPGIATLTTIERWKEEYGEDSPFYLVRAKGDFVLEEQAKIITLHNIMRAQKDWADAPDFGPLSIGADPAGDSGEGDEFLFSIVRGCKLLALYPFRGLTEEAAIANALSFIREYRRGDESVRLVVDAEGPIGSAFYGRMRALSLHLAIHDPPNRFECFGIKSSQPARRDPTLYERIRDELWACLAEWMRLGAIPPDHKLEEELYAPGFAVTARGLRKATHKDVLREKLGRSPDRADSLALAVWTPSRWIADDSLPNEPVNVGPGADVNNDGGGVGLDPFSGGKDFDPYGN